MSCLRYTVISEYSDAALEHAVNEAIILGWVCQGGVSAVLLDEPDGENDPCRMLHQAMVREGDWRSDLPKMEDIKAYLSRELSEQWSNKGSMVTIREITKVVSNVGRCTLCGRPLQQSGMASLCIEYFSETSDGINCAITCMDLAACKAHCDSVLDSKRQEQIAIEREVKLPPHTRIEGPST